MTNTASYFAITSVTPDAAGDVTLGYLDTNGTAQTYQVAAGSAILTQVPPQVGFLLVFIGAGFTIAAPEVTPVLTWQNVQAAIAVDTAFTAITTASGVVIPLPLVLTTSVTLPVSDLFAPVSLS